MFFSTAVVLIPRMPVSWLDVMFGLFLISEIIFILFGLSRASFLFPTTLIQLKGIVTKMEFSLKEIAFCP